MLTCLYTTVKNISGSELHFGFLPPHGVTLADDEELSVAGDLNTRLAASNMYDRVHPSYEEALEDQELVVLKTPGVMLYDPTDEMVRMLAVDDGVLGTVEPCFGEYSEEA